jgi:hypothetical protein
MRPKNWLAEVANPFLLKIPPKWFLRDLATFDQDLVLFPGQTEACYRLARKRSKTKGIETVTKWVTAVGTGVPTETAVYVKYGLLPVMALVPTVQWSPLIFHELRRRDTWTVPQADRALDAMEERAQDVRDRTVRDELAARAGSAYRAMKRAPGGSEVFVQGYRPAVAPSTGEDAR